MKCEEAVAALAAAYRDAVACAPGPEGRLRIVTPHLYPDHDNIEVYVRELADGFAVSDLGETIRRLDMLGVAITEGSEQARKAEAAVRGFKAGIERGIIVKRGGRADLGKLMLDVAGACQAVAASQWA